MHRPLAERHELWPRRRARLVVVGSMDIPYREVMAVDPSLSHPQGSQRSAARSMDEVELESVVQPSSHSTRGNPKTIEEVRRNLRLHAGTP